MTQQTIGIGASANDGNGDDLRTGGDKINDNFSELYARTELLVIAGEPTASDVPAGIVRTVRNTVAGEIRHWTNVAGTLYKSAAFGLGTIPQLSVQRNSGGGAFNAGFSMSAGATAGQDFEVSFEVVSLATYVCLGFSASNADATIGTIEYCVYLNTGIFGVYQSGGSAGSFGSVIVGDRLAVKRTGTTVTYLKNGSVLYTSSVPSSGALVVDSCIYDANAVISEIEVKVAGVVVAQTLTDLVSCVGI